MMTADELHPRSDRAARAAGDAGRDLGVEIGDARPRSGEHGLQEPGRPAPQPRERDEDESLAMDRSVIVAQR